MGSAAARRTKHTPLSRLAGVRVAGQSVLTACERGAARRLKDDDSKDVMLRDGVIHFVKPPSS